MSDAHRPVQAPPPFPPPILLTARRTTGNVLTAPASSETDASAPPNLERKSSVAGNILLVHDSNDPKAKQHAYFLQRKIKDSLHGTVRVGFVLRHPTESEAGIWELVDSASSKHEMVAVKIRPKSKVEQADSDHDPRNELSALQWITANDPEGKGHLLGPTVLAEDETNLYAITPYKKEGSLFDYCDTKGKLSEPEARFFFRQMIEGLENLKSLELCHRNLSLDSVLLHGTSITFAHLIYALRIPCSDDGMVYLIEPQDPCGTKPACVAPEVLNNQRFDGTCVDLWSVGVMLFAMLLGVDALFDAPIQEDNIFKEICLRGNLKTYAEGLSDSVVDLLQGLLRAEPRERWSFETVKTHPWVIAQEVQVPSKLDDSELDN